MPTSQESAEQHAAYQKSSGQLDDMIRQANPGAAATPQADFEQVVQSFYLSAVIAMGAATEPGQKPQVDIIGARQSIDLLAVLVEKTKGNLTDREQKLLQTALFNLRMMFLEITNSIAAQAAKAPAPAIFISAESRGGELWSESAELFRFHKILHASRQLLDLFRLLGQLRERRLLCPSGSPAVLSSWASCTILSESAFSLFWRSMLRFFAASS